jgi:CheY-like chemotaxis protein
MSTIRKYIIVDDDSFNNMLCKMQIENALGEVDIRTFEIPEEALAFIQTEYSKSVMPAILFLDINMPAMTGWDFMEQYKKFNGAVKMPLNIYLLSSSIDALDKDKAEADEDIKGLILKPLLSTAILSIAGI